MPQDTQGQSGQLVKLTIESYTDAQYRNQASSFKVMFNPNKYATHYEIEYNQRQAAGTAGNAPSTGHIKSQELSLDFLLDGTGVATGQKEDVERRIDEFLKAAYHYDGQIHTNRYLRLIWGTLVFDCKLKSADITYTLFSSQGYPLRANVNAKFTGFINDQLRERRMSPRSPDVFHERMVQGHDRLDNLTASIYNTPIYYLDVARANQLTNFRKLRQGSRLIFPPLVKEKV